MTSDNHPASLAFTGRTASAAPEAEFATDDALVSVVIPARNEAGDIERALEAVLAQRYPLSSMEVIVAIDDRSTDTTEHVAHRALEGSGLARWEVFRCRGGSTPANLNAALARSRGDFVCRVDARSRIPPDYVNRCVAALEDRADVAVVGGRQRARARSRGLVERAIARALNNSLGMGLARYRRTDQSGPADTVYLGFFRRAQLVEQAGWNESFPTNQDFELNRRLAGQGLVWVLGDQPVEYLPRRTMTELFSQYHRFGRWKVRYWRWTGDRPRPRQLLILGLPAVGALVAPVIVSWLCTSARARTACGPVLALGLWLYDRSCVDEEETIAPRLLAPAASALVAAGWLSGVARETLAGSTDG